MPLFDDKDDVIKTSADGEEYEILPEKAVSALREEVRKAKEFEIMPTKQLHVSLNELNSKLDRLLTIFDAASKEIKLEEGGLSFQEKMRPLIEKMNKILEQNSEIAEGIVALADMVKDFREELETKGITVTEKKQGGTQPEVPLFAQSQMPTFEPKPFAQRMPAPPPVEAPMIAPPPFEAIGPPSAPPSMAPPKKRLFGL